jgi:hypothetical protein
MLGLTDQEYKALALKLFQFYALVLFFSFSVLMFTLSNSYALDPEIKPGVSERFEIAGEDEDLVVDENAEHTDVQDVADRSEAEDPDVERDAVESDSVDGTEAIDAEEAAEAKEPKEAVDTAESKDSTGTPEATEAATDGTPAKALMAVPGADIDFVETEPVIKGPGTDEAGAEEAGAESVSEVDSGEPEDMGQVRVSESQKFALQRKQEMAEKLFDQLDVLTFFEVDQKERSCDQEDSLAQMRCEGSKAKLLKLLEMDAYRTACRQKGVDFLMHVMDYHRLAYANAYHTAVDHYKVREIVRSDNYDRAELQKYMNESFQRLDALGFNPAETQTRIEAQHIRRDVTLVCGRMMKYFAAERPMEEMQEELDEIFRDAVPQAQSEQGVE